MSLAERNQLDVLRVLFENNDRFAYSIEELSRYKGPASQLTWTPKKIFLDLQQLGEKELIFAGEQGKKLAMLGFSQ